MSRPPLLTRRGLRSPQKNPLETQAMTQMYLCHFVVTPLVSLLPQRNNRIHRCRAIRGQKCRESANEKQQESDRDKCGWVIGRNLKQQRFDETRSRESANQTQQTAGSYQR